MSPRSIMWLLAPILLGGCAEPFSQPGTWHATGAGQANIDAQTVDKADAVAGRGLPGSDGLLDTSAAMRLYEDKAKPLKAETTTGGS